MHIVEIGLAFVEGLALIASPCILPILPLVLATSVDSGRRRPFGIILGFILAFTIFALLSRELVAIFHFNLDYIKYGSLVLLAALGIIMLFEALLEKFSQLTQSFASLGTTLSANARDGFLSGILIGILIGFVWTPCAGPILATALVQIIRQQNNLNALLLIAAFAVGAGVPMLVIALTGRKIIAKVKFLNTHASLIHKALGVLILVSVGIIVSGVNVQAGLPLSNTQPVSNLILQDKVQKALDNPYPAPQFATSDIWLNTPNNQPLTINELKGKVILIDFWTYSCINCLRTLPYINSWYEKYHDKGLVIVGVHSPEFEFEKNRDNVAMAIANYKIKYPVAMDNNLDTWTNYSNSYWPAHYLIDKNGNVVYSSFGEGEYDVTENNIRVLLGLNRANINTDSDIRYNPAQTPETYLGYQRSSNFASLETILPDSVQTYTMPKSLPDNNWALSGKWLIQGQKIVSQGNNKLELNFTAQHVYLVLGSSNGKPVNLNLKLNGKAIGNAAGKDAPNGNVTVKENRLYELIDQGSVANGLLEIDISTPGVEAYAFTFG